MKRILKIIILAVLITLFTSITAHGSEGGGGEYLISEDGDAYVLSVYNGGAFVPALRSEKISDIMKSTEQLSGEVYLIFKDVFVSESLELSGGSYNLSGSLTMLGGAELSVSCDTVISGLNLTLADRPMRIKDGAVKFESGKITSGAAAVILDYSASARFIMTGGSIAGASESGALLLSKGSAVITGGSISNLNGCAIASSSTLMLADKPNISGVDYGIVTDTPITLSYLGNDYSGAVSVKFLESFAEGSISCVFYSATEASLENIDLYDKSGREQELSYFDSYEGVGERRFGAVYLPYKVNFYSGELLFATEEFIYGRVLCAPTASEKRGYEFVGWCVDDDLTEFYDFAKPPRESMNLYAKYRLLPPSFSLSSLSFTYDGEEHDFGITGISHPLFESAVINYRWFKGGIPVSDSGPQIKLSRVSESGEYKCRVTFTYGTDTVTLDTPSVSVNIKKALVEVPEISPKYYNGEYQSPDIYATSFFRVEASGGTAVGIYPTRLLLLDPENCEFEGGGDVAYADFKIIKAENFFTDGLAVFDVYEGMPPSHKAAARFGEVEFLYSDSEDGVYSGKKPTSAGIYYCVAVVSGCENYGELRSRPIRFQVIKEEISGISIKNMPSKKEYSAFDEFLPDGLILSVTYNSGRVEAVSHEKISFRYQSAENFRYGDNAVIAYYLDVPIPIPVTVSKAEYDVSDITFENLSLVYDGRMRTIEFFGTLPMGLDGIPLTASVSGGGVDAGIYSVILSFSTLSRNYSLPASREAILTVTPFESLVVFSKNNFVYDGLEKCPSAYYTDILGRKVELSVSGARSLAGEYIATAVGNDSNYKLIGAESAFVIAKADYDFSGAVWSAGNFVYDGEEKSVTLSGLPIGVSVIGYSDNKATSAGKYTAKAALLYDEANYNPPPTPTYEWVIEKADYDLSLFDFEGGQYTYNGDTHYPIFIGYMPIGIDGIALEYSFSGGVTHVNEGKRKIEITFFTKSINYNIPDSICKELEVKPLGISVLWNSIEFTYDIAEHLPRATASECEISVVGAKRDAGVHTATAIALDSDYYVINSTCEFSIRRAENIWLRELEIKDVFEGKSPAPYAECLGGEVYYVYFDREGRELSEVPTSSGVYSVMARSDGGINYLPIESGKKEFEIIAIIPVAMSVRLHKAEFFAFETISPSDFSVTLRNNDGSETSLDGSVAEVLYLTADSLRCADSYFTVSYLGFSERVEISVKKADYNLDGAYWQGVEEVYDGSEKRVTLLGLPVGVEVKEYIGGKGTLAGEYPVSVILSYDAENYNPPRFEPSRLIIKKKAVAAPEIPSAVYNGKEQKPNIAESPLFEAYYGEARDAGKYPVTFKLKDSLNYEFASSSDELTLFFEIMPRKITLELSDIDKYPLSSMPKPSYRITAGEIVPGEELKLEFIYKDNEVSCKSLDSNYELTVEMGRITRHKNLSSNTVFIISLSSLGVITLVFAAVILILKRQELALYLSVAKCRLSKTENKSEESEEALKKNEMSVGTLEKSPIQPEDVLSVNAERANELITDSLAKDLVRREDERVTTDGKKKRIVNVDTLSRSFSGGERVDVNILKEKGVLPADTAYVKVLARGEIDKPLKVYANDFSPSAVKMIALTGGEAVKVVTVRKKFRKKP